MVFLPLLRITLTFSGDSPVAMLISLLESWLNILSISTFLWRSFSVLRHLIINEEVEVNEALESVEVSAGSEHKASILSK